MPSRKLGLLASLSIQSVEATWKTVKKDSYLSQPVKYQRKTSGDLEHQPLLTVTMHLSSPRCPWRLSREPGLPSPSLPPYLEIIRIYVAGTVS